MDSEYAIVGGGIVGLSVAYGLLGLGKRVTIFDEGDNAFRASRGNFGLVWVQGKGLDKPAYARWTQSSAAVWRDFADELSANTGAELALRQDGGYDYHLNEADLEARAADYEKLKQELDGDYPFEILGHNQLKKEEPHIGHDIAGAILHHQDGHVNPLKLLRTLAGEVRRKGAIVNIDTKVTKIDAKADGYRIESSDGKTRSAARVVLSAGLGATALAPALGFENHIRAQRGQVLITEKLPPLIGRPSGTLRQVDEGAVQIGASAEEVGLDDRETMDVVAALARDAVQIYPMLERAKLVRSWAALRIMSMDGYPIYQQSKIHPGVFMVTCHSGITLAAAHARFLPTWLEGHADAPDLTPFSEDRFDVSPS